MGGLIRKKEILEFNAAPGKIADTLSSKPVVPIVRAPGVHDNWKLLRPIRRVFSHELASQAWRAERNEFVAEDRKNLQVQPRSPTVSYRYIDLSFGKVRCTESRVDAQINLRMLLLKRPQPRYEPSYEKRSVGADDKVRPSGARANLRSGSRNSSERPPQGSCVSQAGVCGSEMSRASVEKGHPQIGIQLPDMPPNGSRCNEQFLAGLVEASRSRSPAKGSEANAAGGLKLRSGYGLPAFQASGILILAGTSSPILLTDLHDMPETRA